MENQLSFFAMAENHRKHRDVLANIPNWIPDGLMEASVFRYGVPERIEALINADIGSELTYSDAISYLAKKTLLSPIRYLEVGVSVGKNFYQLAHTLPASRTRLVALDIEAVNPVLEEAMNRSGADWRYFRGDVFDNQSWEKLSGQSFNLVFSDAFHSGDALLYEYNALVRHNLLDPHELVMVWDDLGGSMTAAYEEIVSDLKVRYKDAKCHAFQEPLRGWLGENEGHHHVGFFVADTAK